MTNTTATTSRPISSPSAERGADVDEQRRAGGAVQQAHAVQQHGAGEHAEQVVLDAGLVALAVALAPGGQHVGGDRQQLEGDEHADEVAARRHHHHAEHAAQQQHVELALVVAALLQLGLAHQHDDVGGEQEQRLEDQRELVDDVAAVEQRPRVVADHGQRDERDAGAEQDEPGERGGGPLLRLVDEQVGGQHDVDADDQHELGRERVPVDDRRRPVRRPGASSDRDHAARGAPPRCGRRAARRRPGRRP